MRFPSYLHVKCVMTRFWNDDTILPFTLLKSICFGPVAGISVFGSKLEMHISIKKKPTGCVNLLAPIALLE